MGDRKKDTTSPISNTIAYLLFHPMIFILELLLYISSICKVLRQYSTGKLIQQTHCWYFIDELWGVWHKTALAESIIHYFISFVLSNVFCSWTVNMYISNIYKKSCYNIELEMDPLLYFCAKYFHETHILESFMQQRHVWYYGIITY